MACCAGISIHPLDGVVRVEADGLGKALEPLAPVRVLSSPLARAVHTARAIATYAGAEVRIDLRLTDRDYGRWAGKTPDEVIAAKGSIDAAPASSRQQGCWPGHARCLTTNSSTASTGP